MKSSLRFQFGETGDLSCCQRSSWLRRSNIASTSNVDIRNVSIVVTFTRTAMYSESEAGTVVRATTDGNRCRPPKKRRSVGIHHRYLGAED
jgi:hypothetical protein